MYIRAVQPNHVHVHAQLSQPGIAHVHKQFSRTVHEQFNLTTYTYMHSSTYHVPAYQVPNIYLLP